MSPVRSSMNCIDASWFCLSRMLSAASTERRFAAIQLAKYKPPDLDPDRLRVVERRLRVCFDELPCGEIIALCHLVEVWPTGTRLRQRDDWGDYTLDPDTNALTMTVTGGNFIPDDTDLQGTVEFRDDRSIVLRDMYLGAPEADGDPTDDGDAPTCGHVLE